ncbi:MAG: hypothetical protein KKD44_28515 [Proteobacteria bacterium]|nr:hypothetical protein [Pseudomonadota bacterium]
MYNPQRYTKTEELPASIRQSMGIGKFRAKVFARPDGEIIVKAMQDIGEVVVKIVHIRGDRVKSVELTEDELRRVLLMARDIRKATGQQYEGDQDQAWLEQD